MSEGHQLMGTAKYISEKSDMCPWKLHAYDKYILFKYLDNQGRELYDHAEYTSVYVDYLMKRFLFNCYEETGKNDMFRKLYGTWKSQSGKHAKI